MLRRISSNISISTIYIIIALECLMSNKLILAVFGTNNGISRKNYIPFIVKIQNTYSANSFAIYRYKKKTTIELRYPKILGEKNKAFIFEETPKSS